VATVASVTVLFLGPSDSATFAYLREVGENVTQLADPLDAEMLHAATPDSLVSHGYRHILKREVFELVPVAINLHISYLPWNRGADPNLWSWLEGTPKGVSVHHMDEGIDTGAVIAQRKVEFGPGETLASSYRRLQEEIVSLLKTNWLSIRAGTAEARPQQGRGSFHRVADRTAVAHLLTRGWDTPVADLDGLLAHKLD
jgi:methionyl-tRNA formyltransferase